ncbi:LOW QUALITY PROTEIN: cytochrome P450 2G1-like [Alligator sinensis]|uniref:LOW QUALITY PROTEIN: cytochrome P450 2G1-like n=1 Tax=Alligator sinensis TaxID=38654 RepID=A0A3Q0HEC2_ALLSI|nr:LOW QUALITY PROTEIN: cytochrome P450 2G1-like [Alligator sinensis]
MELGDAATLLLAACLMIFWEWKRRQRTSKLPPGPTLLEPSGYLLQARNKGMLEILRKVKEKYSPVFPVNLGMWQLMFLCDSDSVREALVDQAEEFSGRVRAELVDTLFQGHGVAMANGERWKQLRRFCTSTLRNFGMGKKSIEEQIQEESQYLVEEMGKTKGSPFDPTLAITHSIANVICSIVFGNRFDYKDQNFLNLMGSINNAFLDTSKISTLFYETFPRIMKYIPGPHNRVYSHYRALHDFILERVRINQQSLDPSCPRDFIDSFLIRTEEEKQNPQSEMNTRNLVETTIQLVFAGTETTSSTLRFGFLLLVKYPEVQGKVDMK